MERNRLDQIPFAGSMFAGVNMSAYEQARAQKQLDQVTMIVERVFGFVARIRNALDNVRHATRGAALR